MLENPRYTHLVLFVCQRESGLFLADLLVSSLWHGRFACLSKTGIAQLSKASYIPQLFYSDHQFVSIANTTKMQPHLTRLAHQENQNPSIWSTQMSVNLFYIRLLVVPYTSSCSSTMLPEKWVYSMRTKEKVFVIF